MEVARLDGAHHFLENSCRNDWEGLDPNTLNIIFSGLRAGDVTRKDIPNLIMMSLYDEYLKICDFEMRGIEKLRGRADSVSDIACIACYKGYWSNAAASGRFGLLQRERVGSREGLVQVLDRGCGEEDKTLPMVGCLTCEAHEYARRQEKNKGKVIQYQ